MSLTGNKGEWSELYAFVKLLSTGKLYAADEKVNKNDNVYFPILKILRSEDREPAKEYIINPEDGSVEVHSHAIVAQTLSNETLVEMAMYLYDEIVAGNKSAFAINGSDQIMDNLACTKISASSTDKTDIRMQLHDIQTGYDSVYGFSIKSELGNAPTLLNASGATNFVFEVIGLTDAQMNEVNNINTKTKILDRIERICTYGAMKFKEVQNSKFSGNLMLIDTYMDNILAEMLLDYYQNNVRDCRTLVSRLEARNPMDYPRPGLYEYKFKNFLCAIALGMTPAKDWDGIDEANGGYVIVKEDGEVVAYHLYNRNAFETYLLNNTKFDSPSTTRHGFASIYKETDGKMYIKLNLQIRFT